MSCCATYKEHVWNWVPQIDGLQGPIKGFRVCALCNRTEIMGCCAPQRPCVECPGGGCRCSCHVKTAVVRPPIQA